MPWHLAADADLALDDDVELVADVAVLEDHGAVRVGLLDRDLRDEADRFRAQPGEEMNLRDLLRFRERVCGHRGGGHHGLHASTRYGSLRHGAMRSLGHRERFRSPRSCGAPSDAGIMCAVSGRPLRIDEGRVVASVSRGDGWSELPARGVELDSDRAARWTRDALDEHASIGAFARLSLQLLGVGAPASLLRQTQRAALDQIRHAELCFDLATRFSGVSLRAGPLPLPRAVSLAYNLATIAVEALLDGAVNEGLAAADARARCEQSSDPTERTALRTIARDELRHVKLAESIVSWCVDVGGPSVVGALLDALDRIDGVPAPPGLDERVATRVRRSVAMRVRALLSNRAVARLA